jgi:uncharacterized protein DUF5522
MDENQTPRREESSTLEPEDYYFEGPYLVFTAAYHLKRGYCCGSNCRHCPYREEREGLDPPA